MTPLSLYLALMSTVAALVLSRSFIKWWFMRYVSLREISTSACFNRVPTITHRQQFFHLVILGNFTIALTVFIGFVWVVAAS